MIDTRRRELIVASACAASLLPSAARGAAPCARPDRGATQVHTSAANGGVAACRYATDFDLTENPISERGAWTHVGRFWTSVRTANGLAFGTNGAANSYDDSYALLSGFAPDQQGEATVHVDSKLSGSPHEVEILLRWADSLERARGYECLFNFQGGVEIVRWNGPFGDFTVLPAKGPGAIGRRLVSGDVVKATVVGRHITAYVNGFPVLQASDSVWTNGEPGIGFFKRLQGLNTDFAVTRYVAANI